MRRRYTSATQCKRWSSWTLTVISEFDPVVVVVFCFAVVHFIAIMYYDNGCAVLTENI